MRRMSTINFDVGFSSSPSTLALASVQMLNALLDVKPDVTRRLVVPFALRLDRLHLTLQAAFGWTDSHLFEFFAGEVHWGIPNPDNDYGQQLIDARKARLSDIIHETGAKTIHYLYDFGDSWDHVIKFEKWLDDAPTDGLPLLLDAVGRCPPEDVGVRARLCRLPGGHQRSHPSGARTYAPLGLRAVRSQRRRPGCARGRRQRIVGKLEAASAHHAVKIDVKRQSKGPLSYAYDELASSHLTPPRTCLVQ
jgi:hypothetical protein